MANAIYSYCKTVPLFAEITDRDTLRRAVKLYAMEFAIDNSADIDECLNKATIDSIVNKFGR